MIRNMSPISRRSLNGLLSLTLLSLTLLAITTSAFAADVPAPKRLPTNVVAYFSVPDVADLKKRYEQSQFGQMVNDAAMAEFISGLKTALAEASKEVQAQGGVSIDDLLALPSGNASIAVLAGGGKGPGYVLMLNYGTNQATIDKLLGKASEGLANNGAKKTQIDAGGVSITNFELPAPPPADPNDPLGGAGPQAPKSLMEVAWFLKDQTLVVGNGADTLRSVIARWDGKNSSTFGDNPVYRYIAEKGASDGPAPVIEWYFDPISTVTGIINGVDPNNFQAQLILGFLPTLGLDKIKAVGGTMNMVTPKYEEISRTVIYVDPPRTGALDLLKFPATAQSPPKWVPANVSSYMSLNWDLAAAWRGVSTLVDSFNPQGPGTFDNLMDQLANDPAGPMIHPKKDLVDHLSGRIQFLTDSLEPANAGDLPTQRMLFAFGVKNVDSLKATVGKLINMPGSPAKPRQFRGETIYSLPTPAQFGGADSTIGIAITKGELMIGVPDTLIEQAIRGDVESLADSASYKKMAANFPAQVSSIQYAEQNSQVKTVYELLRSGSFPPTPPGAGFPGAEGAGPLDFTKLPPYEVVEKYLSASASYIIPDKNGAVIVSFSPKKTSK